MRPARSPFTATCSASRSQVSVSADGRSIALGAGIGTALGVALDNIPIGVALGAEVCAAVGAAPVIEAGARASAAEPLSEVATQGELAADVATAIAELRVAARAAADAGRAESTERAYAAGWRDFSAFANRIARGRLPAEPEAVALYVADLARRDRKAATIARKFAAIAVFHRSAGHASPTEHDIVRAVVRGRRRQLGVEQKQKTALELDALRTVVGQIPRDARGLRDRALLLVGWAAALRRSELAALRASQLRFEEEGVIVWLRRSKTDQEGAGDAVALPFGADEETCPVRAFRAWLDLAGSDGAVFGNVDRHGNIGDSITPAAIATVVCERAGSAGVDGTFAAEAPR